MAWREIKLSSTDAVMNTGNLFGGFSAVQMILIALQLTHAFTLVVTYSHRLVGGGDVAVGADVCVNMCDRWGELR